MMNTKLTPLRSWREHCSKEYPNGAPNILMRTWISQGRRKHISGQVAAAVISGRPVEEIIERIGHSHRATTRELARVLGQYGYLCSDRCVPGKRLGELPRLGLAQVHASDSFQWHWVAVEDGHIFDGVWGDAYGVVDWPEGFRITSYLPIEE